MSLRGGDKTVEYLVTVRLVTAKAILVIFIDPKDPTRRSPDVWIPKSQIAELSEIGDNAKIGDTGHIEISEWLAREKGFIK
jgi:hypothetical protein